MYVELTGPDRFAIQDLTTSEMELLQSGLIELKQQSLQDAVELKEQRMSCNEMFQKIDLELVKSKQP